MMYNFKKSYRLLLLILICFYSFDISAQTKRKKDTIKSWEVGVDLLWLIDKNQLPGNSIFLRTNFITGKGQLRAWRLRLGMELSYRDSTNIGEPLDNKFNRIFIMTRMGYEWQYMVEEKALLYYGMDLGFSYTRIYEKRILYNPPGNLYQETFTTYEPALIGFIGCRYNPKPWISISLEASLQVAYRIRRNPSKVTRIDFPNSEGGRSFENSEELKINIFPITFLNISFHINK